ncbi:sulfatase-like hydrolase/transferase [Pontiellaceae bacterium B12227]|nr:sulfatase-like hydrolase/transferase [Pontiellaceae bacterium B12227]
MKSKSRRDFLKTSGALLSTTAVTSLNARAVINGDQQRPNLIFIMSDQMRGDAMGCMGSPDARTSRLDEMAAKGTLFERAFSNNPVCAPSRMSMFSGKYPHQVNRLANIKGKTSGYLHYKDSLGDFLKQQGYTTAYIGKNHTYEKDEIQHYDYLSSFAREPFRKYNAKVPPYWYADTGVPREQCMPKQSTDNAIEFMSKQGGTKPFFMHISYFNPHPPYMAPADVTKTYDAEKMTLPEYVEPSLLSQRLADHQKALHYDRISDETLQSTKKYYHAAVDWGVDYQVGRLLDALKAQGLDKNTIVVFTADHGDFMGEYRMVRKAMYLYDALMHVPMIWCGPGIKEGQRIDNLAQCLDIFPTLADFSGGEPNAELEGRSLKPFLNGESKEEPDYAVVATAAYSDLPDDYFKNPEKPLDERTKMPFHTRVEKLTWKPEQRTAMARTKDWKLILNESQPNELYYMNGGTSERKNVINDPAYADVVKKLTAVIHKKWDAFLEG